MREPLREDVLLLICLWGEDLPLRIGISCRERSSVSWSKSSVTLSLYAATLEVDAVLGWILLLRWTTGLTEKEMGLSSSSP